MLGFYGIDPDRIEEIRSEGLPRCAGPYRVETRLGDAKTRWPDRFLLVLDLLELDDSEPSEAPAARTEGSEDPAAEIPGAEASAALNLDPPRPPEPITAAGGYVLRGSSDDPELLLIYRRGVWDLPKGTVEAGETPVEAARREVREEVGLEAVRVLEDLGRTVHGYYRDERYWVKTTFWYAMTPEAGTLRPEREENIERVVWTAWPAVANRLGYETLREHFDRWQRRARRSLEPG